MQDCSRGNTYHNKKFKECAESHGLEVAHHERYGWTVTTPSLELLDFIEGQGWTALNMVEGLGWTVTGTGSGTGRGAENGAEKPPKNGNCQVEKKHRIMPEDFPQRICKEQAIAVYSVNGFIPHFFSVVGA